MKDIAKKILVGLVVLEIIITFSAVIVIENKNSQAEEYISVLPEDEMQEEDEIQTEELSTIEENKNEVEENLFEEIIQENYNQITEESEIVEQEEKKETKPTEKIQSNKVKENPSKTNTDVSKNTNVTKSDIDTSKNNVAEIKQAPKEEKNNNNNSNNSVESIINNNISTSNSNTNNSTSANVTQQNVETYKFNKNMTDKMISTIKANASEYMEQYGYNVIVADESIIELTNEFTFTEKRIKDKIEYKFGTIKVYARDYYVNNEYRWTECYLI